MSGDSIDWTVQDWEDLIPRLLLLAVLRLTRPAFPGLRSEPAADAAEAQDYVDHAVAEAVSGRRPWDPDHATLYEHLAALVVESIPATAGPVQHRPDGGAAESEPDAAWREARRGLLDHVYDRDDKLGEMATLILLENCLATGELSDALEVGPLEVTHMRQRMKHEVRDYLARHGG